MEFLIMIAAIIALTIVFGYVVIVENITKEKWMVERLEEGDIIYVVRL